MDSVNIPTGELVSRVHELPPRQRAVLLADVEGAVDAALMLESIGRVVEVISAFEFDEGIVAGRLWSPNPFLLDIASQLAPGLAVDLGCGSGRDSVALAGLGWRVIAVDHLPDALALGEDLARRYLTPEEAARIEWRCADLESGSFVLPRGCDLISMFWYLNRPLLRSAIGALARGGGLVLETFTAHHREVHGKPRTEAFVLQPGEVEELVAPLEVRMCQEDWHDGRHSARVWAVRSL